jgi:anti-sigma factor RsiW
MAESTDIRLTCEQVTALLIDYVTGELDPATTRALQAHLHNCRDCDAFWRTYTETIRTTRTLRYDDMPEEMQSRVHDFLRQKIAEAPQS